MALEAYSSAFFPSRMATSARAGHKFSIHGSTVASNLKEHILIDDIEDVKVMKGNNTKLEWLLII